MLQLPKDAQTERKIRPTIHSETNLPIYWINEEWAVTAYGLESVCYRSSYYIDAARLGQKRGDRADWPAQIEDKGWTDPRLFLEAFQKALEIHGVKHDFDWGEEQAQAERAADMLVASREASRRRAEQSGTKFAVYTLKDLETEEDLDDLIDEGFRAPPFPKSCVDKD